MNIISQTVSETPGINISEKIDLSEYNYSLPNERIAQYPVDERDMSKLLICDAENISDILFRNIDEYIPAGHLLIFNNTRVVRARLNFQKSTGAAIEIFCIEPVDPSDYERSFSAKSAVVWKCIVGNLKKWKTGKLIKQFFWEGSSYELSAEKLNQMNDAWEIQFSWDCPDMTFATILEATGHIPLPPYIDREDKEVDATRYQTIYAQIKGSVAAPTAGLHFTDRVFEKLQKKGIKTAEITLHVGAGTFQPIKSENISEHEMHCEHFIINRATIKQILENYGKIIAVGTTSVRTLESIYWIGKKLVREDFDLSDLSVDQWEPYINDSFCSAESALIALIDFMDKKGITSMEASTSLLIVPGYEFNLINGIITNFHQPGSTLLLLVSAWTGNRWKDIYNYALETNFRFLSYGDSSLLFR
ncbi:MAG TPA: S-adenosylmethionine:tRNA ribosyltransferase-isomerase [Bacteroidales bacterium]|nr:S-adenosylmethionine:tRNA ribosyltransferase-isomerase [Bacteroidales bacterium]